LCRATIRRGEEEIDPVAAGQDAGRPFRQAPNTCERLDNRHRRGNTSFVVEVKEYAVRSFLNIAKALSEPTRLRALLALRSGELCLCHLITLLELSPSTVSKHLDVLYQAGLVERRKEGRWCYFRLAGQRSDTAVRKALHWVDAAVGESEEARKDAERVAGLRNADRKKLACCYKDA
jgi:ArsR family transcriptional regulator